MSTQCRSRPGAALIEVLVASLVLATSVLAALALMRELAHALDRVEALERRLKDASSALAYAASLPTDSLSALVTARSFADLEIRSHPYNTRLWRLTVGEAGRSPLLETLVLVPLEAGR